MNRLPDGGVVQWVEVAAVAPAQGRGVQGEVSTNLLWYKNIFAYPEQNLPKTEDVDSHNPFG